MKVFLPIKYTNKNGKFTLGNGVTIFKGVKISIYGNRDFCHLKIGDHVSIGDRTEIHCGKGITIGNNSRISWDCCILDRDYHAIDGFDETIKEVVIGDHCLIGCNSIILKGVHIGDGAVIGAGSVVVSDVKANSVYAGNPAIMVKKISKWS